MPLFRSQSTPKAGTQDEDVPSPDLQSSQPAPPHGSVLRDETLTMPSEPKDDDLAMAEQLSGAYSALGKASAGADKYAGSRSAKVLNKSGDVLNTVQTGVTTAQSYTSPIKAAADSDALKGLKDGVNSLVEHLPAFLKLLDQVAKIHPFIDIAVGAFKVVVELDLKRRDNDKKIRLLLLEMRDMMAALLQLGDIKDEHIIGPDGTSIEARMQGLVNTTAKDIKTCASACDTYVKKKLVVKVLKSASWDDKLKTFVAIFSKRRDEFCFALSMHIGVGVNSIGRQVGSLHNKMDLVLEYFAKAVSAEHLELAALVQSKGSLMQVTENDEMLKELLRTKPANAPTAKSENVGTDHKNRVASDDPAELKRDLDEVKRDLFDSPDAAIRKNFDVFERKFEMQRRELAEELRRTIHHEGDRVIEAVTSGPHDRIIDPDIHEIWKEMQWRGNVKARHFVLALRDYYREKLEEKRKRDGDATDSRVGDQDEWALEYINVNRLQAISEAFDDDASGFITVAEVNQFTASRPKDWSLPHWLAYWAVGWQMTATYYRGKIDELTAKMFSIRSQIHPANRIHVDVYLSTVWTNITELVMSLAGNTQTEALQARFQSYVDSEEERLREGLDTARYDIDAMDTLLLVTGPGRIEKYFYPLLYLLLRRDLEIFRIARTRVIHEEELWDSVTTIMWVFGAIAHRHDDLETLFKQQNLDPAKQFKNFACEMFDYWHDSTEYWSLESLKTKTFLEVEFVDKDENQNVDPANILNYPLATDTLPPPQRDEVTENDTQAEEAVKSILGRWHGWLGLPERFPITPMFTIAFHAASTPFAFEVTGSFPSGTEYHGQGEAITDEDGTVRYTLLLQFIARFKSQYLSGTLSEDGRTFSGLWGYDESERTNRFFMSRVAPEILVARPRPEDFEENRIKALWRYALAAALNQVRRDTYPWSYLHQWARKAKYITLLIRESEQSLEEADLEPWAELDRTCTFQEVQAFFALYYIRMRSIASQAATCDVCSKLIHGSRLICMQCGTRDTIDLHDQEPCRSSNVQTQTRDDLTSPHLPTHDMLKLRRPIVHFREIGALMRNSTAALERARKLLEKDDKPTTDTPDEKIEDGRGAVIVKEAALVKEAAFTGESYESLAEQSKPACVRCESHVSKPCFFCVDCMPADVFVCIDCGDSEGVSPVKDHQSSHTLVRCIEKPLDAEEESNTNDTDASLEELKGGIRAFEGRMNDRLSSLEKLMEALLSSRL